jgi:hypothetical protein
MDQRIEAFLADVLALAGEEPDDVRQGVCIALADCEAIFRAQKANKRIRCHSHRAFREKRPAPTAVAIARMSESDTSDQRCANFTAVNRRRRCWLD